MKCVFGVVTFVITLHLAGPVHGQGNVPEPSLLRYVHLMAAKQYAEAFDLVIDGAGKGEPWAKAEMSKLSEVVLDEKKKQLNTSNPEYVETMALLMKRLQRASEEGNAEAEYILGMKALVAVPPNRALGIELLTKAANQNHKNAIDALRIFDASGVPDATSRSYLPDVDVPPGDFYGRVVDGTTGQPIEGAIVVANWDMYLLSIIPSHGPTTSLLHVTETVTDVEGRFVIPNLGLNGPPLGWKGYPGAYPRFMVFKPGYATSFGNQGTWKGGFDTHGKPLLSADVAARYRNEQGLVYPLYEYAKNPPVGSNRSQPTRVSSAEAAASYLKRNIDIDDLSRTSAKARQVIQSQIRAFVAVNEELEQASGKAFSWGPGGEIDRAIDEATGKEARPKYILKTKKPSHRGTALANPSVSPDARIDPNMPLEKQQGNRAP